jgi:hypothetical protein
MHLKTNLSVAAITKAFLVWEKLQGVVLRPDTPDSVTWRWTSDGSYSAATAYAVQFAGAALTTYVHCIWYIEAPTRCRIMLGWRCRADA